jgi:cytochrome P450
VIVKARRLARDDAERERAAAAVKTWLLAQIEKKRAAPGSDIMETATDTPFASERLAA